MTTLEEEMHLLFDPDEDVQEWILIGRLPQDIADLAAKALSKKEGTKREISLGSPDPYMHIARLVQRKFFPDAPPLEKGGFMRMMMGGPVPSWMIQLQVAAQIVDEVKAAGYEVEECEADAIAKEVKSGLDEINDGSEEPT